MDYFEYVRSYSPLSDPWAPLENRLAEEDAMAADHGFQADLADRVDEALDAAHHEERVYNPPPVYEQPAEYAEPTEPAYRGPALDDPVAEPPSVDDAVQYGPPFPVSKPSPPRRRRPHPVRYSDGFVELARFEQARREAEVRQVPSADVLALRLALPSPQPDPAADPARIGYVTPDEFDDQVLPRLAEFIQQSPPPHAADPVEQQFAAFDAQIDRMLDPPHIFGPLDGF